MKLRSISFSVFNLAKLSKESALPERVILVVSESQLAKNAWLKALPKWASTRIEKAVARLSEPLKAGGTLFISGIEKKDPDFFISVLPENKTTFDLLGFARGALKEILESSHLRIGLVILEPKMEGTLLDCFGSALAARVFSMPEYGKRVEKRKPFKLKEFVVYGTKPRLQDLECGWETGEGTNLVRYLGTLPPNELNTGEYGKRIQKLCRENKIQFKFYSNAQLKKMGAGAFTAVDQGDPDSKGGIYELTYSPGKAKNKNPVALVGKGLCFDTGGYDIKTGGHMLTMKGDMQGSAVAMSTLLTASRMKLPIKLKAFLGVTENHVSPKAYKADEVILALNGISIEVINTDAEGRMVLADTLALASRGKPEMMVDFATLTGTATVAIGTSYSAGFTNRDHLHSRIVECGKQSGERVWTFPLDKDFGKALESPIADTIQCTKGRSPDHILAAFFLEKFVGKDIPWVHIDLSAAEKEGGLAHTDSLFTGFGVRWAIEFLRTSYKV